MFLKRFFAKLLKNKTFATISLKKNQKILIFTFQRSFYGCGNTTLGPRLQATLAVLPPTQK